MSIHFRPNPCTDEPGLKRARASDCLTIKLDGSDFPEAAPPAAAVQHTAPKQQRSNLDDEDDFELGQQQEDLDGDDAPQTPPDIDATWEQPTPVRPPPPNALQH